MFQKTIFLIYKKWVKVIYLEATYIEVRERNLNLKERNYQYNFDNLVIDYIITSKYFDDFLDLAIIYLAYYISTFSSNF